MRTGSQSHGGDTYLVHICQSSFTVLHKITEIKHTGSSTEEGKTTPGMGKKWSQGSHGHHGTITCVQGAHCSYLQPLLWLWLRESQCSSHAGLGTNSYLPGNPTTGPTGPLSVAVPQDHLSQPGSK